MYSDCATPDALPAATRVDAAARRKLLAGGFGALVIGWSVFATASMVNGASEHEAVAERLSVRNAEVAALRAKVAIMQREGQALQATVLTTVNRLEARQQHLEQMLGVPAARMVLASSDAAPAADALSPKERATVEPLARIENQQLALINHATTAAHARFQGVKALIRQLGLDPARFTRSSRRVAVGGPLEDDAPVQELTEAWNTMAALGDAMASIPSKVPVARFTYTSGFGVRYDPFNGRAVMHAGVDMAGAHGEPILSAAEGVVVRAGWVNGYGNLIEVDHGRGITTRYGHLGRIQVRAGDRVSAGDQIGKMGSTGRSTGTHLHFEVRVDGQAVDPLPFIEAAPQIAAVQAAGRADALGGPASIADEAPIIAPRP